MGSVFKRGKTWYIDTYSRSGMRIRKAVGTSKKLAQAVLADIESKILRNEYELTPKDILIDDLFKIFQEYSQTNHSPSTYNRYRGVIRSFKIYLGYKHPHLHRVSQLDQMILESYKQFRKTEDLSQLKLPENLAKLTRPGSGKVKTSTVNYDISVLRIIFKFGVDRKLCAENPCTGVKSIKVTDSKSPRFLSKKECSRLLESCSQELRPIFYAFLNTGLRLGELLNLQWEDIDFGRRRLLVRKKEFWHPKTGEREVPLNNGMLELLKSIKKKKSTGKDFVFTYWQNTRYTKKGEQLRDRFIRNHLVRSAREAGIEGLTKIHDLRHTFASQLVMAGVDLPTVQKLLGHSDIQTTMIYAHLAPDHLKKAVDKLEF